MNRKVLLTVTSVPVWRDGDYFLFDRKFYDGTCMYIDLWPGSVHCLMGEVSLKSLDTPEFGLIKKKENELPFRIITKKYNTSVSTNQLAGANVVLASGDNFNYLQISQLCKSLHIPCFYTIEYIPETRYQIARLETTNLLRLLRRYFFIWNGERKRKRAFKIAAGIQANGGAAYEHYTQISQNSIMYYDTRVTKYMLANKNDIKNKVTNRPTAIRLAFSGRLEKLKGVDHLLLICFKLDQLRIDFKLNIYGGGPMASKMKKYIASHNLEKKVCMKGVVDFKSQLLPIMKSQVDVFVCLHRQSDPSCTYLETLSCGVPIVGYLNRSFGYIMNKADIGWGAQMNDQQQIVDIIIKLAENKTAINQKSYNALKFASQNTFGDSFGRRIRQLGNSIGLDSL